MEDPFLDNQESTPLITTRITNKGKKPSLSLEAVEMPEPLILEHIINRPERDKGKGNADLGGLPVTSALATSSAVRGSWSQYKDVLEAAAKGRFAGVDLILQLVQAKL